MSRDKSASPGAEAAAKISAPTGDEVPKKSRKKLLVIIVAVLLVGGAGSYFFLFSGGDGKVAAPKPGLVVPLDPVTLNLEEGHYLKLKFALQATDTAEAELDGSKAIDIAIDQFSNTPMAALSTHQARNAAKKDLAEKIEKAYEGEVMDVYFTEFVMQ